MAFRFRRSIKLAPGLRLNVGKRGVSVSAGVRGASVTLGRNGLYGNVGAPGTGISYRTRLAGGARTRPRRATGRAASSGALAGLSAVKLGLAEDGSLSITATDGTPLPPSVVKRIRKEYRPEIEAWLQEQCDHW